MSTVRVKYIIEWVSNVEIPEGCNDIQKYARNVAAERLEDCLNDGEFITSPDTEVKTIEFTLNGRKFPIGKGWNSSDTKLVASNHGYEGQLNQNPFEKNDARHKIYESAYKAGCDERYHLL